MMSDPEQIYSIARQLIEACQANGYAQAAERLDDALHTGSSALETLGAIRAAILDHGDAFNQFMKQEELDAAVKYVDAIFGRS